MGQDQGIDRRTALKEAAAAALALMASGAQAIPAGAGSSAGTAGSAGTAAGAVGTADFRRIAAFITGKADLADEFVDRAHAALTAEDPSFEQRLQALIARVGGAGLTDVEQFKASPLARDNELMKTAMAIVSALYLGYVAGPDGGRCVSYEAALMWRPTADVLPIPSYAPAPPGWWAEPPKT
jgi:hypothetical protein